VKISTSPNFTLNAPNNKPPAPKPEPPAQKPDGVELSDGKGVRYADEKIITKVGKSAGKK
jgi:hypothetical protein